MKNDNVSTKQFGQIFISNFSLVVAVSMAFFNSSDNKKYSFEFWKKLKEFKNELQETEKSNEVLKSIEQKDKTFVTRTLSR